jgi:hypothetical protein
MKDMSLSNCKITNTKDEYYFDEKKKRNVRIRITTQECLLIPKTNEISKKRLTEIIREEIHNFLRDKDTGERLKGRPRTDELFPGYDDMKRLSLGITEDEDDCVCSCDNEQGEGEEREETSNVPLTLKIKSKSSV